MGSFLDLNVVGGFLGSISNTFAYPFFEFPNVGVGRASYSPNYYTSAAPFGAFGTDFYCNGLFMPRVSSPYVSQWGPSWYNYDKWSAGAALLGWGGAMLNSDPFLTIHPWDPFYYSTPHYNYDNYNYAPPPWYYGPGMAPYTFPNYSSNRSTQYNASFGDEPSTKPTEKADDKAAESASPLGTVAWKNGNVTAIHDFDAEPILKEKNATAYLYPENDDKGLPVVLFKKPSGDAFRFDHIAKKVISPKIGKIAGNRLTLK